MRLDNCFFLGVLIFLSVGVYGQNLVLNPSFETLSSCPQGPGQLDLSDNWQDPFNNIVGDTCSTSDLFNVCSPFGGFGVGVPNNILGSEAAHTGDGYAGIIIYEGLSLFDCNSLGGTSWREYLHGELSSPLVAGEEYCVSFWVSLADDVKWGSDNFNVLLTNNPVNEDCAGSTSSDLGSFGYSPQLTYTGPPLLNTSGWTLLSWSYIASGGEEYITIGNFENDANTNYTCVNETAANPYSYYYIDDVNVSIDPCCLPGFTAPINICESDAAVNLTPTTSGGTWSGPGVDASGNFDPGAAGVGTHQITYTIACGSETIEIVVDPCTTLDICEEANGDLTVLNGTGPYSWEEEGTVETPITNQTECEDCGYTWTGFNCVDGSFSNVTECSSTGWIEFATGTTVNPPSGYPIQVSDDAGATVIINDVSEIPACDSDPCAGVTIDVTIDSQTDVSCAGDSDGTATVSASGGASPYDYIWQPGSLTGASQTGLAPDTYTVGVQDDNGCTGQVNVTIDEPLPITVNPSSTDATCGSDDGEVSVAPTGGDGNYTYSWSPGGQTTATVSNVGAGSYDIVVTDGNDCTASATVTVNTTNGPSISVDNSTDVSCFGEDDGTATVSASGGNPNYTFTWSPGGLTGDTQNNLSPGDYDVQVEDADGCTSSTTVTIGEPAEIELSTSSTASSCTVDDGSATVSATGGDGSYSYSWSPGGGSTATINNVGAGSYTVTVTDGNGCTAEEIVNVPSDNGPGISIDNITDASCFGDADGSATISVTGGTPGFTYDWSPSGGTNPTENGLSAGSYTVTVEDAAGCISTETITINEPDQLVVNGNATNAQCASSDGAIFTNVTGGDGNYSYSWTPTGETTPDLNGLAAGTYDLVVTDGNSCTASESFEVNQGDSIDVNIVPDNSTIQAGDEVNFDVTTNPTVTNPTYTWSPSDGLSCTNCQNPVASPNSTTTYTVIVNSDEGCVGEASAIINIVEPCADPFVPTIFSPNEDGKNDALCLYGSCFQSVNLAIYNRWGEKVFETSSTEDCWDGTYRGKKVNSGTYVYKLTYNLFNEDQKAESGNITVVR